MDKKSFFLLAMQNQCYRKKEWVIRAFSVFQEKLHETGATELYPYKIVRAGEGYGFIDPANPSAPVAIEGTLATEPLFRFKDAVQLEVGDIPTVHAPTTSSYGRVLANYMLLIYPFGTKLPFINTRFTSGDIEELIARRVKDDPIDAAKRDPNEIYISDYLKFSNAAFFLTNFCQLAVPGDTEKSMTTHPDMARRKAELFAQYKDELHDPAVLSKITDELIALDKEWLKNDPAMGLLIFGKDFKVVRKKLHVMVGDEAGFRTTMDADPVQKSLREGWDLTKFSNYVDGLRAGSYYRGSQTSLGGESTKWLLRVSSNINVTIDDCGSKMGKAIAITKDNVKQLLGFRHILESGRSAPFVEAEMGSYLGKTLSIRSPMYCKVGKTDYCKACVGELLAENPHAVSTAITRIGDLLMDMFMKKMHGTSLTTAEYDFTRQLT